MKTNKLLYGLLAFAPIVMVLFMFVLMGMMISEIVSNPHAYGNVEPIDMPYYGGMMIVGTVAGVMGLIGMITYVIHCLNNVHIMQDKRTMWIVILVLFGTIGMIIYYFKWIHKEVPISEEKPFGF